MTVKYKRKISTDTFTPNNQSEQELQLAYEFPAQVCDILGEFISDARKETIMRVISHRTKSLHVAVEGVHDPHNTAAIIRTADAFGVQNIHIIEGQTKFRSSAAVTQGAHKWVDVTIYDDTPTFIDAMHQAGRKVLVAAMDGSLPIGQLLSESSLVLVFGNESAGISQQMRNLADGAFHIPMFGFVESFNVSVAAAISISALRQEGTGDFSSLERSILQARYYLRSVRAGGDIVKTKLGRTF